MAAVGYGFEDLAENAPIPVGGAAFFTSATITNGQTVQARATAARSGSRGLYFGNTNPGFLAYLVKTLAAPTGSLAFTTVFKQPTPPAAGQERVWSVKATTTADNSGGPLRLDLNSDGRFLVRNAAGATISAAQVAAVGSVPPVGTWVMFQVWLKKGTTTTNGQVRARMERLDTSAQLFDSGLLTNVNTGVDDFNRFFLGWEFNTNTATATFEADNINVDPAVADNTLISAYTAVTNTAVVVRPQLVNGTVTGTWTAFGGAATRGGALADDDAATGIQSGALTGTPHTFTIPLDSLPSAGPQMLVVELDKTVDSAALVTLRLMQGAATRKEWTVRPTMTRTPYLLGLTDTEVAAIRTAGTAISIFGSAVVG